MEKEKPMTWQEEMNFRDVLLLDLDGDISHKDVVQGYRDQMKLHKDDYESVKKINKARDALVKKYPKPEVIVGGIVPVIEE